jgi:hypothetical protein
MYFIYSLHQVSYINTTSEEIHVSVASSEWIHFAMSVSMFSDQLACLSKYINFLVPISK